MLLPWEHSKLPASRALPLWLLGPVTLSAGRELQPAPDAVGRASGTRRDVHGGIPRRGQCHPALPPSAHPLLGRAWRQEMLCRGRDAPSWRAAAAGAALGSRPRAVLDSQASRVIYKPQEGSGDK